MNGPGWMGAGTDPASMSTAAAARSSFFIFIVYLVTIHNTIYIARLTAPSRGAGPTSTDEGYSRGASRHWPQGDARRVKGGGSLAKRTLDAARIANTLMDSGRPSRPSARTLM